MSLRDWSSPFHERGAVEKRATSRKKLNSAALETMADDDTLADFEPIPEPVQRRDTVKPGRPPPATLPDASPGHFELPPVPDPVFMSYEPQVPQSDLSEKVAYMIQLLEDQRDERTNHVTEEIILYVFLGIFVIFVVDTFVKTGKYSR